MPALDKSGKGRHCMFAAGIFILPGSGHAKAHFDGQEGAAVMKIVSWNVNGLAACKRKGFLRVLANSKADFFCCQEIKTRCPLSTPGYLQFWNPAKHPGIERFLFLGLTDVFCAWYPQADRPYIWWSMRLNKRLENRGQLGYFLVSDALLPAVRRITHHMDILASDHRPISPTRCLATFRKELPDKE